MVLHLHLLVVMWPPPIVREARSAKLLRCSDCTARLSRMCSPSLSPSGSISSIACCMAMTRSAPRPDTRYGTRMHNPRAGPLHASAPGRACCWWSQIRGVRSVRPITSSSGDLHHGTVLVRGSVWKCRCHASSNFRVTQCDSVQAVGLHLLPSSSLGLCLETAI